VGSSWCSVVSRDPYEQEDLWWSHEETETTASYLNHRLELQKLGYTILSTTGDGFSGIKQGFWGIPYQMCLVHMERLVTRGTTKNPQTEAGVVLLALARTLHDTASRTFLRRLRQYIDTYRDFLNEKTRHPISGEWSWTHESLRMALNSLVRFREHLFTFETNLHIPKNTNSLEGHFSHIGDITDVHRGLSREHKEKVLDAIFLAGTIAPNGEKLDEIL
jgi:hypothetical protein